MSQKKETEFKSGYPSKLLGVMGGMGPAASQLFYGMVIEGTDAACDQDHIDMILINHASMPDRTAALSAGAEACRALFELLLTDARMLERNGADAIVITCNTSHALADELQQELSIPIIHMVRETAREMAGRFAGRTTPAKVAILATDGTVACRLYQQACEAEGLIPWTPSAENQKRVMRIIYDGIKNGGELDLEDFAAIESELQEAGCRAAIMGCTELSVFKAQYGLSDFYLDAMRVLADRAIAFAGGRRKPDRREENNHG